MKKILTFILLFISFNVVVNAKENVYIESVIIDDNSTLAEELSTPQYSGLSATFDVGFKNLNDFIKYKIVINNNTSTDYEIDSKSSFKESDYLKYEYIFNNNDNIVKKNSKTTIYIKITYIKEVPASQMENNTFIENNEFNIVLSDDVVNPKTGVLNYTLLIGITLIATGLIYFLVIKKQEPIVLIVILSLILIPCSHALSKIQIQVSTKVTIKMGNNVLEARYLNQDVSSQNYISDLYQQNEIDFWKYSDRIERITFKNDNQPIEGYDYKFDVSESKNNSITAYVKKNSNTCSIPEILPLSTTDNSCYDVYIVANGKIYANQDSSYVFGGMSFLKEIKGIENYDTSYATSMKGMFIDASIHVEEDSTKPFTYDLSNFNTSNVTDMSGMFNNTPIDSINLSSFDTSNVTDMSNMFEYTDGLNSLNLRGFNTEKVTDMSNMFYESSISEVNLSTFNTRNVTDMSRMFAATKLITLNLSNFNTEKVTTMHGMFQGCDSLRTIDLSSFNTPSLIDMGNMFYACINLTTVNLSSFDTKNVVDMGGLFYDCNSLTSINLSGLNTSKVTYMGSMFYRCLNLNSLDLSSFNTSNVTSMNGMFNHCESLLELDLSTFNTSKTTNVTAMFFEMTKCEHIYVGSGWDVSHIDPTTNMFYGSTKLPGYNQRYTSVDKAHTGTGGYLEQKSG